MKSGYLQVVCILSCIFMLLCTVTVNGMSFSHLSCFFHLFSSTLLIHSFQTGCPGDSDTGHTSADYNQRLYSYSSRQPVQVWHQLITIYFFYLFFCISFSYDIYHNTYSQYILRCNPFLTLLYFSPPPELNWSSWPSTKGVDFTTTVLTM